MDRRAARAARATARAVSTDPRREEPEAEPAFDAHGRRAREFDAHGVSAALPPFEPMPRPPLAQPGLEARDWQRVESSSALIQRLQLRVEWWLNHLPSDQQPVILAILSNGMGVYVNALSAEGHNGVVIEGNLPDQGPCMIVAHQATVQLLCFIEKVEVGQPRRAIGFNVDWSDTPAPAPAPAPAPPAATPDKDSAAGDSAVGPERGGAPSH